MVVSFLGSARITSLFTHNVGNSIMIEPLSMRTECLIMFSPDARANEVKKGIPVYDLSLLPVRCDGASVTLRAGQTVLVSAAAEHVVLEPSVSATLLECYV